MQRPCQTAAEVFVDIRSEKIISFMIHRLEHSSLYSLGVGETTGQAVQCAVTVTQEQYNTLIRELTTNCDN